MYALNLQEHQYEDDSKEDKPSKDAAGPADPMDLDSSYSQDGDFLEKDKDGDIDSPQQHQQKQKQKLELTSDQELFEKYVEDHEGDVDLTEFIDEDSCDSYVVPDSIAKVLQKAKLSTSGKS